TGIYVARIDGTETRTLLETSDPDEVLSLDGWYPDGNRLFADSSSRTKPTAEGKDFSLDFKTGERREIPRPEGIIGASMAGGGGSDSASDCTPSRSGRFVARRQMTYPHKITIIDWNSGHEEPVIDRDADRILGWADDDTKLLFSKSSGRGTDLWSVAV